MSTNLRLDERAAAALRAAAAESGRSQQELLREAVDRCLGLEAPTEQSRTCAVARVGEGTDAQAGARTLDPTGLGDEHT